MQPMFINPLDYMNIHPAFLPVDLETGANTGLVVSLKGYAGAICCLFKKAGTAGDDPVFTLKQSQDVSATGEKALNFTEIRSKLHATTVPGLFTTVTQAAANTYTDDTAAEKSGLICVWVPTDSLDVNNNFDCIRMSIPDTGSAGAELGGAFYILCGSRYGGAAMLSPLVD